MVFKNLDLEACEAQTDPEKLLRMWTNTSPTEAAVRGGLVNDLEPPAFLCSSLEKLKGDIAACEVFRDAVMMSGSGTSIYAITEKTMTDAAADAMTKESRRNPAHKARGSPLLRLRVRGEGRQRENLVPVAFSS